MDKEIAKKIEQCKALQGMTVEDVINSKRFRNNLALYLKAQKDDRIAIRKSYAAMHMVHTKGVPAGYKLPSHPIDKFLDMSTAEFANEYKRVVAKVSVLPSAQRAFVYQLGQQAYSLTIAQVVVEEYPELEPVLIPKNKAN